MNISDITRIEDGKLYFAEGDGEHALDLRTSADALFDAYYKSHFWDKFLGTRRKNIYVGAREFVVDGTASIVLFDKTYKYEFEMEVNQENVIECRERWHEINCGLNAQGFWLLDLD